jgi:hypothetical protein
MTAWGMARLMQVAAGALIAGVAILSSGLAPAETEADAARLDAEAMQLDPVDFPYVRAVCTVCHTPAMFLHAHLWQEWLGFFHDMVAYGAGGTQEQWDHIYRYFQETLTVLDVNHADEDELVGVLGVDEPTAIRIVQRRIDRRITSVADLESVRGVDPALVDRIAERLLF